MPLSEMQRPVKHVRRPSSLEFCLKVCEVSTKGFHRLKLTKLVLFVGAPCASFFFLLQSWIFLCKFDFEYFFKYATGYVVCLYAVICIIVLPAALNIMKLLEIGSEPTRKLSKKLEKKFKKEVFYISAYMAFNFIMSLVFAVLLIIPNQNDNEVLFLSAMLTEYFPEGLNFLMLIYRLFIWFFVYTGMAIPAPYLMFGFLHFKLGIYQTMDNIENINQGFDTRRCLKLGDFYHKVTTERLLGCIRMYCSYRSKAGEIVKTFESLFYPFKLLGTAAVFCCVFPYFLYDYADLHNILRWAFLIFIGATILMAITTCGQDIEDSFEQIFATLMNVQWYHWSPSNKRTYLIFLACALRPFRIKFSQEMHLNHEMALEIGKVFFSAVSLINTLQGRKVH